MLKAVMVVLPLSGNDEVMVTRLMNLMTFRSSVVVGFSCILAAPETNVIVAMAVAGACGACGVGILECTSVVLNVRFSHDRESRSGHDDGRCAMGWLCGGVDSLNGSMVGWRDALF